MHKETTRFHTHFKLTAAAVAVTVAVRVYVGTESLHPSAEFYSDSEDSDLDVYRSKPTQYVPSQRATLQTVQSPSPVLISMSDVLPQRKMSPGEDYEDISATDLNLSTTSTTSDTNVHTPRSSPSITLTTLYTPRTRSLLAALSLDSPSAPSSSQSVPSTSTSNHSPHQHVLVLNEENAEEEEMELP